MVPFGMRKLVSFSNRRADKGKRELGLPQSDPPAASTIGPSIMQTLQDLFEEMVKKQLDPACVLGAIVTKKLKARGIQCSKAEKVKLGQRLAEHLMVGAVSAEVSTITIDIGKNAGRNVDLSFTSKDIEKYHKTFATQIGKLLPSLSIDLAKILLSKIKRNGLEQIHLRHAVLAQFEANLYTRWRLAFESYEFFLMVALEAGEAANQSLRVPQGSKGSYLVEVLTRLHARACQIVGEVLVLLRSGYADGAHARWRTLHEISVVTALLSEHGEELAERYFLHEAVESLRAAKQFNEHSSSLGKRRISKKDIAGLEKTVQTLCDRFGNTYASPYGWMAKGLNDSRPHFNDLEKAARIGHLRPYYKLASYNVHASPKGDGYRLGLPAFGDRRLLAGPSNAGLEEAGMFAPFALLKITLCLLTIRPTLDSLVYGHMLLSLYDDTKRRFIKAANRLERDECRQQQRRRSFNMSRTQRSRGEKGGGGRTKFEKLSH